MSRPISIGILGCANIAERQILPSICDLPELFRFIGVASRTHEKATALCRRFGGKAFSNYEDILAQEGLEAIYIPLPNALHFPWAKKALEYGVNVLIEKPLACSLEEARQLVEIARNSELILLENFQFRYHSQMVHLRRHLEIGTIGELRNVRSSFGFPPFPNPRNIRYQSHLGGGALLDAGVYPIKISQELLGLDLAFTSASLHFDEATGVGLWGAGSLHGIQGGPVSQIAFGFDNFYQCNIELWGSKGKLCANRIFTAPPGYKPTFEIETEKGKRIMELPEDNHFKNMLTHFHRLVIGEANVDEEYQSNLNQARLIAEFVSNVHVE